MALTIETGQIVAGADSFATVEELVAYAADYGRVIPADTSARESILRRAYLQMDVLPWKGQAQSPDQTGSWPRVGVVKNGFTVPESTIPDQIKAGQMALATEIHTDDMAPPELKKGAVTKERVEGAVERQYAEAKGYVSRPAATRQSYAQFGPFLEASNQVKLVRG
ncbi:hypothetical protein D9M71_33980 [compost metagenome]